eukprot:m.31027 g.31027  ORF g.31027 m.31027 type:complete len:66 (+) comp14676_c0_seq1:270-467(+)
MSTAVKIYSTVLANRLKPLIGDLVDKHQTEFQPGKAPPEHTSVTVTGRAAQRYEEGSSCDQHGYP